MFFPLYNLTTYFLTVSGVSSGGYFAGQFHIAASSMVRGAAIFAAGPYMCAKNSLLIAESECMSKRKPSSIESVDITETYALEHLVDSPIYLRNSRVYLFSGLKDTIVHPDVVRTAQEYYEYFIPSTQIIGEYSIPSEHCIPTMDFGEPCEILSSPYLGACRYSGAYSALDFLYDSSAKASAQASRLFQFDQRQFIPSGKETSLDDIGYIYVPENCIENPCRIHISFHGCKQGREYIGNTYALHSGFNGWAEDLVILYPYIVSTIMNPNGCWDWWGYTDMYYGTRRGIQIQFILNILDAVSYR